MEYEQLSMDQAAKEVKLPVHPYRDKQVPSARGSETSAEAARMIEPTLKTKQARILALIRDGGHTNDEMQDITGWPSQTVTARTRELVKAGLAKDGGDRRKTHSGRRAVVWVRA